MECIPGSCPEGQYYFEENDETHTGKCYTKCVSPECDKTDRETMTCTKHCPTGYYYYETDGTIVCMPEPRCDDDH